MADTKDKAIARRTDDPFALLRRMSTELERAFDQTFWPSMRWPAFPRFEIPEGAGWAPKVDVFEKHNRLITKVDLPGVKKEDVTVQVSDGYLALSGERKEEKEEKQGNVFRTEREYGKFYRAVPLPEGVELEDVKATFADGVLEVSVPIPAKPEAKVRKVEIQEPVKAGKAAA